MHHQRFKNGVKRLHSSHAGSGEMAIIHNLSHYYGDGGRDGLDALNLRGIKWPARYLSEYKPMAVFSILIEQGAHSAQAGVALSSSSFQKWRWREMASASL